MKINIAPLSQRDEKWRAKRLGFGTGTIGQYGCVIADIAMMVNRPVDAVNEQLKANNCFTGSTKNLADWGWVPIAYSQFDWAGKADYDTTPAPLLEIDGVLAAGKPVIIKVEADEIGSPKGTHFVLVVGKEKDDYLVADPWFGDIVKLGERYSHNDSNKPEHVILGIRKLLLKQGLPVESDKVQHWYEPGDENEDPNRLREDRDKNHRKYEEEKTRAGEFERKVRELEAAVNSYQEMYQDVVNEIRPEDNSHAGVVSSARANRDKAMAFEDAKNSLKWCTEKKGNIEDELRRSEDRVRELERRLGAVQTGENSHGWLKKVFLWLSEARRWLLRKKH